MGPERTWIRHADVHQQWFQTIPTYTSKTPFGGDKPASERLSPARAELCGSVSNWLSRHPSNWSLSVYQIWAQSVQPFLRSETVTLHVRTCKVGPNLLFHATLLIDSHQYAKFERNRFSRSRDLERSLPCTCARAAAPNCGTWICIIIFEDLPHVHNTYQILAKKKKRTNAVGF